MPFFLYLLKKSIISIVQIVILEEYKLELFWRTIWKLSRALKVQLTLEKHGG